MPLPLPGSGQILPSDIHPDAEWPTKYTIDPDAGCWIFGGGLLHGYGRARHAGRAEYADRLFYRLHVGPIPDGMTIDHVRARGCRSKACVNPQHLEVVTGGENARRARLAEQPVMHCIRDHVFDEKNTYHHPNGKRVCRTCRTAARREARRVARMAAA